MEESEYLHIYAVNNCSPKQNQNNRMKPSDQSYNWGEGREWV